MYTQSHIKSGQVVILQLAICSCYHFLLATKTPVQSLIIFNSECSVCVTEAFHSTWRCHILYFKAICSDILAVIRLYYYQYCETWGRYSRDPRNSHFTFFQAECESERSRTTTWVTI